MLSEKNFPLVVSAFILAVGVLFLASAFFELSFLNPSPSGKPVFLAIAAAFISAAVFFIVMHRKGNLDIQGKPVEQVRKEAVAGLESEELLADIALNDPVSDIRKTARRRLEELECGA